MKQVLGSKEQLELRDAFCEVDCDCGSLLSSRLEEETRRGRGAGGLGVETWTLKLRGVHVDGV